MNRAMVREGVPPSPHPSPPREDAFVALEKERKFLWGLCYRMTGSASDAEDLVQEAFVRALERPPADTNAAWRPWLVRVAMNLSRDQLRKRKRRSYHGVWLPTPVEATETDLTERAPDHAPGPETRYGLMESASYAFLVALEELTTSQRAVLVLRDAFDYSSRETADILEMTEENVRITLHRARKAMAAYDEDRFPPGPERTAAVQEMFGKMMALFYAGDVAGLTGLLSEKVVLVGDGGGVFHAGPRPVKGPAKIAKMYFKLGSRSSTALQFEFKDINGDPGAVTTDPAPKRPNAPKAVLLIDLDKTGRVRAIFSIIAPQKLAHVRFPERADMPVH